MNLPRNIVPMVRTFRLGEEPRDVEFWRTLPVTARLAALQAIRLEHHGWTDATEPRLQRVYRIVKR
ncbi:MAG: hypothetical protein ACT4QA_18300 [Panacagrimonas sp.]